MAPTTLQSKLWDIAPSVTFQHLACFPDLPPLLVQLLHNRQLTEEEEVGDFLKGRLSANNPYRLKGMNEAVTRLRRAIAAEEEIAIYGDFDTDGVTATALLVEALSALGAHVRPYIPHRVDEGYGLNLDALRELYRQGVRLVVTVDCGIRSVKEVERASRGLDLIVTDHHNVSSELPPATAVINPKQTDCPYPFKDLAGVGVAYKLAQGLLRAQQRAGAVCDLPEESLLDLVALGTVADMAPLLGENRVLVQRGIEVLNALKRPGVGALMADAGLRTGQVDTSSIGFRLAPRLNAAGRIDTAMLAYQLLTSHDVLETRALADRLGKLNQRRQQLTERTVAEAKVQVEADDPEARLYLAASRDFLPGIVGLAASRLTDAYYRPSAVVELGDDESRGSCRSIPEFDITNALDQCQDLLLRHGGHSTAAGFTVATKNLNALHRRLQELAAERLAGVELRPTLFIDADIPLEGVNWATHALLSQLEPCGVGNPRPVLLSRNVKVSARRTVGRETKHLKLDLRDERGATWDAIAFRKGDLAAWLPDRVDVAYNLDANEWNSKRRLQLIVQDLSEASPTDS